MNPWDSDGDRERPPRKIGWGCLAAAIIGSATSVVVLIIVIKLIASTVTP